MRNLVGLPKTHLHVHLESTVRPATLAALADANGVPLPPTGPATPVPPSGSPSASRSPSPGPPGSGFTAFARLNGLVRDCLVTADDFARVAYEFCADAAADGVRWAEVTFTAAAHGERVGDRDLPIDGVLDGLARGGRDHGVGTAVIVDHPRKRSVARLRESLRLAVAHDAVVAIGVAGEESHPLAPFAAVFDEARAAGVGLVHHAGEACGPSSIREALVIGHADRIGHGIRALDDPALVAELAARRVPLEVCPSSNVALGFVASFAEHPLPALRAAGVVVTLDTDVPSTTGATLSSEFALVRDAYGWDDAVLADLARAAVDASFAPPATKAGVRAGIASWLDG